VSEDNVRREGEEAKRETQWKKEKPIKIEKNNSGDMKHDALMAQICRCVLTFRRNLLGPSLFCPEDGVSSFL
jgi:hypothetical protein